MNTELAERFKLMKVDSYYSIVSLPSVDAVWAITSKHLRESLRDITQLHKEVFDEEEVKWLHYSGSGLVIYLGVNRKK